jgi:cytochrome oxidase assembly protein ShyY1
VDGVRFLLRPGWLALIVAVVSFVVACYTLLAPWQFGREAQRDAAQQAIDDGDRVPPVPLADLSPPGAGAPPEREWRQATVSGVYLPAAEAVVRLRSYHVDPAFEVLTPLRTDDGRLLVVDRGLVLAASPSVVPRYPAPPAGRVTLIGRLRPDEVDPQHRPVLTDGGRRQLYAAAAGPLAAATGLALEPGLIQLNADQPGVLIPVPAAVNTSSAPFTNFSYALQWLTFGAIALIALGLFIRLELLQRRGDGGRSTRRSALRQALAGDDPPVP